MVSYTYGDVISWSNNAYSFEENQSSLGVILTAESDLEGIKIRTAGDTYSMNGNSNTIKLIEASSGIVLDSITTEIKSYTWYTLEGSLTAGNNYEVAIYPGGTYYNASYETFQQESGSDISVISGIYNDNYRDYFYVFDACDPITDITYAPTKPQNLTGSWDSSNGEIDLTYNEPSDWGGEVGNYEVEYTDDGTNYVNPSSGTDTTSTSPSYSVSQGPDYTFRVRAENSGGASSWVYTSTIQTIAIPSSPSSASLIVNGNDSIDLTVDPPSDWGGEVGSYEIELERDGSGYSDPSGGPSTPGGSTSTQTYNYGPNSDTAYERQVGIDSSFKFRVRAKNSAGSSSWVESGTGYTEPTTPKNPSITRPDANTVTIEWENNSDIATKTAFFYRKDTGSGYGSWNYTGQGKSYSSKGDTQSATFLVSGNNFMEEDARYQFRFRHENGDGDGDWSGDDGSDYVYADYGNAGNVFFEDDFESGDLSNWDSTNLGSTDAGVQSGSGDADLTINGADEGSYYFYGEGLSDTEATWVQKNLGDLSNETDVLVKCAFATASMESNAETFGISWYDGSSWQPLKHFGWEYNRQGWYEVSVVVPSSYLSSDNRIRVGTTTSSGMYGGDHFAVDRVVVSDILHEYTKPAPPTNYTVSAPNKREIESSWTDNASFENHYVPQLKKTDGSWGNPHGWKSSNLEQFTYTGLEDGEKYEARIFVGVHQSRRGSTNFNKWGFYGDPQTVTTILPSETPSASTASSTSVDVSWSDIWNNENGIRVDYSTDGGSTWTQFSDLPPGSTSETITGLSENTYYQIRIEPYTDHTASPSGSTTVYIPLVLGAEKGVIEASGIQTQGEVTAVASGLGEISPSGVTGDQIRIKKATPEVGSISVGEISALPYEVVTLKRSVFDGNSPTLRIEDNEVQPSESSALTTNSATLASTEVYMKQSDTHPPLKAKLNDIGSNEFYHADIQAVVKHQGNSEVVVNTPVDEKDEIEKEVIYYWSQDGTDLPYTGTYQVEFQVKYADGRTETFPSEGYLSFDVEQRLS